MRNDLLTPAQAAHILDVHARTVRLMIERGELPAVRAQRGRYRWRYVRRADAERLARRRVPVRQK